MSPICPEMGVRCGAWRIDSGFRQDTCSGSSGRAARSGTRSTGCPTAARSRRSSGPPGLSAGARPPATSRSGGRGLAARGARRGAPRARCRGWSGRARRSPTPRRSACATSSTTAAASRRRCGLPVDRALQLLPAFGELALEDVTTASDRALAVVDDRRAASTRTKALVLLHGIFQRARKVYGAAVEPGRGRREAAAERAAATSRCSRPRRSGRSSARRRPSRTRRSF